MKRRSFVKYTGLSLASIKVLNDILKLGEQSKKNGPIVIATWNNAKAVLAAWEILNKGGWSLDAVEAGARVPEADPNDTSVGYGGNPDRDGHVTLDACIMDHEGNAGSVFFLEGIMHPISVARKVMEKTPHVYLAGKGAKIFALENGFKEENLLTEKSAKAYSEWVKKNNYVPKIEPQNHDTIGILAQDSNRRLSGACTTSGLSYKIHGRVGDSPIIGSGLYVDNEVGAATATGLGEAVIKKVGSFSIVEFMRNGKSPKKACQLAAERLTQLKSPTEFQVGYIALNQKGEYGAYSLRPGFPYVVVKNGKVELYESESVIKK